VATNKDAKAGAARRRFWYIAVRAGLALAAVSVTAGSAILVKEMRGDVQPLAVIEVVPMHPDQVLRSRGADARLLPVRGSTEREAILAAPEDVMTELTAAAGPDEDFEYDEQTLRLAADPQVRWFNGRPIRPARQLWMTVTGYSPDAESCAPFADGLTASLHSVHNNAMKMVAADTRLFPFGSLLSVPGYDDGAVVPVLDRGGAIKGYKLDLLFPTHKEARQWGRQRIRITIWEYADGLPPDDPRKFR
jgi:3D (Asp-Asp-Asp) domain-containing protein